MQLSKQLQDLTTEIQQLKRKNGTIEYQSEHIMRLSKQLEDLTTEVQQLKRKNEVLEYQLEHKQYELRRLSSKAIAKEKRVSLGESQKNLKIIPDVGDEGWLEWEIARQLEKDD